MIHTHTMATLIKIRLYVCCILCWMLLALSALGSERDTETEKSEAMSVVTETLVEELENGEKIELCVWKYYDQNQILCKVVVQQTNSTTETYWIWELMITFYRDMIDDDGKFGVEFFNVSFLGHRDLSIPAMGGDFCHENYKLATEKNEFIVRETMKHYMRQEHSPDRMSIYIVLTKTKGRYLEDWISFSTELQNLKD